MGHSPDKGLRTFTLIWAGQFVSLLGSGLSTFALGVWTYQLTGSATKFALISMFGALPNLVVLPLAGVLVDRLDRRRVMILSNAGSGLVTLALAALLTSGRIELWHIYLATTALSVCSSFQLIAFSASVALLVDTQHLGRASGMVQSAQATSQIVAPLVAGVLVFAINVGGILVIDFLTYVFALLTLFAVRIPRPPTDEAGVESSGSLLRRVTFGWTYIRERPGLMALLAYFASVNLIVSITRVLFIPMTLNFASPATLGTLLSVSAGGLLLGSVVMSVWGGPKRRVNGVFGFGALLGVTVLLTGLRPSLLLVGGASFAMMFLVPFINGCNQAIWQSKTAPGVQGRVFAMRQLIGWSLNPLAYMVAGPLADKLFEPLAAAPHGALGALMEALVGVGAGRGIALMYVIAGVLCVIIPAVIYTYPRLRQVESELPDALAGEAVGSA